MNIRSWLCASSLKQGHVKKAIDTAADIAHFDLEDSVPAHSKAAARTALSAHFQEPLGAATAVRINSPATLDGLKDILFLSEHTIAPDVLVLPKAVLPGDVNLVASLLKECGATSVRIFAVIESVPSLWALRTLANAPRDLHGLIFGAADFAADLGVPPGTADLRFVKQEIALSARRFGIAAIDSPCFHLHDEALLANEASQARGFGFVGKIAIHPSQVAVINESFTHSPRALADARELVAASEAERGSSILRRDDKMVGPPFVKYARHLISSVESLRRK